MMRNLLRSPLPRGRISRFRGDESSRAQSEGHPILWMKHRRTVATCHQVISAALSVCVTLNATGCATYRASRLPAYPVESFRSSASQGEVTLGAELWYSQEQSKLYFDTNLTKRGLAPVYVAFVNHGKLMVKLRLSELRLSASNLSRPVIPIQFSDAADRMRRKSVGPAIVWGVLGLATLILAFIFVPIGSALAISQTSSVNERLKQDVWNKSLKDADLTEGQEARGVVFFEVPGEVRRLSEPHLLCSLTVGDQTQPIRLDIPLR